jgi:acyl carrier protein
MPPAPREKVRQIVATITRTPVSSLPDDAAIDLTPRWDSLAQLDILASVEQEFGLTIEPEQAVELTSLATLIAHVQQQAH